jgi:hypothetical protein
MQRAVEQRGGGSFLDLPAGIHDDDTVGPLADEAEVVRDEQE